MQITILYPKDDFEAANVAVKVQALAQSKGQNVYVVPKHYGRNKMEIQQKLISTSLALFISQSDGKVDSATLEELKLLKSNKIKIIGFIPNGVSLPVQLEKHISLQRYHSGDSNSLRQTIQSYLGQLNSDKQENQNGIFVVIGLLLFLFLLAFSSDD